MKIYCKNKIFSNPYYDVFVNGIEFANGQNGTYLSLHNKLGGVVVIAKYNNRYVLVEIERPFVGGKRLEFIRGFKKPGETALQAAAREIKEEINCDIRSGKVIGRIEPDSGIIENAIDVVEAKIDSTHKLSLSDFEGIKKVVFLTEDELTQKFRNNEISDGYTLSAFMLYYARQKRTQ